jgi:hypothetical protein
MNNKVDDEMDEILGTYFPEPYEPSFSEVRPR